MRVIDSESNMSGIRITRHCLGLPGLYLFMISFVNNEILSKADLDRVNPAQSGSRGNEWRLPFQRRKTLQLVKCGVNEIGWGE